MLDAFVREAKKRNIKVLRGFYYKTPKNSMVSKLYGELGFRLIKEDENSSQWELEIQDYKTQNFFIRIRDDSG